MVKGVYLSQNGHRNLSDFAVSDRLHVRWLHFDQLSLCKNSISTALISYKARDMLVVL